MPNNIYKKRPTSEINKLRLRYISSFLKQLRITLGYSRLQVSKDTGIPKSVIESLENPNSNNSILMIFEILDYYQTTPEQLFLELH